VTIAAPDVPMPAVPSAPTPADYLEFAYRIARRAGAVVLPHFRVAIDVDDKGTTSYDPVTAADRDAEAVIRAAIAETYPDHGIRGEEHGWEKRPSNFTWVIDPIDGTRSFITGQLHWATLIALNDGARVVAGVIHQPYVDETFLAVAGGPAEWRRGGETRRLATRHCARLADAIVGCTTPDMFVIEAERAAFARVRDRVRLVRYGGDCYAYALLAAGLMDVVIESSLQAYDVQALIPVIEGAGGVITSWTGGRCEEGGDVVACGDRRLHAEVLRVLRESGA
jgi:histidinol phosphatase-like enzyme (inositol monophosphatase family)